MNKLLEIFLRQANGLNTIKDISSITSESEKNLYRVFEILKQYKIAEDSRNIYQWFHSLTLSESPYRQHISLEFINSLKAIKRKTIKEVCNLSNLEKLFTKRKTTRIFNGRPINSKKIVRFLKGIYFLNGVATVPSGGALYPISFYVAILRSSVKPGIYKFNFLKGKLEFNSPITELEKLYFALNNKSMVDTCSFITFVCCNLENHPHTYPYPRIRTPH